MDSTSTVPISKEVTRVQSIANWKLTSPALTRWKLASVCES